MDQTLNPLRILVVDGHAGRRREVADAIASLGHQVILEEGLDRVATATATERPDVAIVVVGEGNSEGLAGIGTIVHESVTERAKGILMERHGIDEREAFEMLRTEARHSNRKVVDIAEAVLTSHRLLPKSAEAEVSADARDHPSAS
jgi:response regulator NasT